MDISNFTIDELLDLREELDARLSHISRRLHQAGVTPEPADQTAMRKLEKALGTQLESRPVLKPDEVTHRPKITVRFTRPGFWTVEQKDFYSEDEFLMWADRNKQAPRKQRLEIMHVERHWERLRP